MVEVHEERRKVDYYEHLAMIEAHELNSMQAENALTLNAAET